MLLKCSRCGEWHPVQLDRTNAGSAQYANEMLYWHCGGSRFYAGQTGGAPRRPFRRRP